MLIRMRPPLFFVRKSGSAGAHYRSIRLPSTAITAGMVHNIHRISIIGHLYCPDIQIRYVLKAIDSRDREGESEGGQAVLQVQQTDPGSEQRKPTQM